MTLKRLSTIALATIAIVLATTTLGRAEPAHGGGHTGIAGHPGARFDGHRAFDAHRFDGRRLDGRHFDRRPFAHRFHRFHGGAVIVAPFFWSYYPYPAYSYQPPAPTYWYCPSYGAYYPTVQSCPEPWVPVPG